MFDSLEFRECYGCIHAVENYNETTPSNHWECECCENGSNYEKKQEDEI